MALGCDTRRVSFDCGTGTVRFTLSVKGALIVVAVSDHSAVLWWVTVSVNVTFDSLLSARSYVFGTWLWSSFHALGDRVGFSSFFFEPEASDLGLVCPAFVFGVLAFADRNVMALPVGSAKVLGQQIFIVTKLSVGTFVSVTDVGVLTSVLRTSIQGTRIVVVTFLGVTQRSSTSVSISAHSVSCTMSYMTSIGTYTI